MKKFLIITGGSSGIGFATAKLFQENNYSIINLSRSKIDLDNAIHIDIDLSTPNWQESLESNFKDLLSSSDQICLIHNASKMQSDTVESFNDDNLREVIEVNLVGPSILNKITIPFMKKGSSILYVGSTLSEKAVPHMSSYVMTKHGMIGLMRSTCQDLFGRFIHTACICPGATETEMLVEYV